MLYVMPYILSAKTLTLFVPKLSGCSPLELCTSCELPICMRVKNGKFSSKFSVYVVYEKVRRQPSRSRRDFAQNMSRQSNEPRQIMLRSIFGRETGTHWVSTSELRGRARVGSSEQINVDLHLQSRCLVRTFHPPFGGTNNAVIYTCTLACFLSLPESRQSERDWYTVVRLFCEDCKNLNLGAVCIAYYGRNVRSMPQIHQYFLPPSSHDSSPVLSTSHATFAVVCGPLRTFLLHILVVKL